jgi:hypothetical protein
MSNSGDNKYLTQIYSKKQLNEIFEEGCFEEIRAAILAKLKAGMFCQASNAGSFQTLVRVAVESLENTLPGPLGKIAKKHWRKICEPLEVQISSEYPCIVYEDSFILHLDFKDMC